jgi:hypothetical protein
MSRISQSLLSRLAAQIKYTFASLAVVFTRNSSVYNMDLPPPKKGSTNTT